MNLETSTYCVKNYAVRRGINPHSISALAGEVTVDVRNSYKGMVIAVGGPPHSGKSVFLAELYRQLLARRPSGVFLQRACPDGEGMWSAESDPELVKEIRRKGSFDQSFMTFTLNAVEQLGRRLSIVLLDLGGRKTAENAEILARSTHLIVLSSREEEKNAWVEFAGAEGCKALAILGSRLVKNDDGSLNQSVRSVLALDEDVMHGAMLNLDRETGNSPYVEQIGQLAEWLLNR